MATSRYKYTVDKTAPYAVRIWDLEVPNDEGAPFIYQPHDGANDWASADAATAWAISEVKRFEARDIEAANTPTETPTDPVK